MLTAIGSEEFAYQRGNLVVLLGRDGGIDPVEEFTERPPELARLLVWRFLRSVRHSARLRQREPVCCVLMRPVVSYYGPDPAQFGELWLPGTAPGETVVLVHGGFWRARYDLSLGRPLAADLVRRGYAVWNLEYRRAGAGGGWPATFEDIAAGIDHLADLPVGTSRVVAIGHSAGGHLAAWAAGRAGLPPGAPGAPGAAGRQHVSQRSWSGPRTRPRSAGRAAAPPRRLTPRPPGPGTSSLPRTAPR